MTPDLALERPTRYGLAFQLTMPERKLGPGPRAFGHFGAGGSLGFADPDAHVAIGNAMNQGRAAAQARAPADRPGVRGAVAPSPTPARGAILPLPTGGSATR